MTAPQVSEIYFIGDPLSGDTYGLGETIRVNVRFTESVTVTGSPRLALTIGTLTRQADRQVLPFPSTPSTLFEFRYTVQAEDLDADGIGIPANPFTVTGGASIVATADGTTAAVLTHAAVADDSTRKVDGNIVTAPAVRRIAFSRSPLNGDTYGLGETIRVQVWFTRPVTATGGPQVGLTIGTRTRQADYTHTDNEYLYFKYEVQADDLDTDGVGISANMLTSPDGASIVAAVDGTTAAVLTHAAVADDPTRKVDGGPPAPTATLTADPTTITAGDSATLTVASANAASAVINPGNRTVTLDNSGAGSVTVNPTATTEYTLTVTDANSATATDTATVTVNPAPTVVSFTAVPSYITVVNGQESTLSWAVAGASTGAVVSIDNGVGADVGLSGTQTVSPAATTEYTLTVTDANDFVAATATATVTVGPPAVSGINFWLSPPLSGDIYGLGETLQGRVHFTSAVTVTGSPQLALTIGSQTRQADYSRSLSSTLFFTYEVQADDLDADGVGFPANALTLSGASIVAAGDGTTAADLTFPAVAADSTRKVDGSMVVAPEVDLVTFLTTPSNGDTYGPGERIQVLVRFTRDVTVTGSPQVELTIGNRTRAAHYSSGVNEFVYFEYYVQAGDLDTDGIGISANALTLSPGVSIVVPADGTTAADLTHDAVADDPTQKVDGGPPAPTATLTADPTTITAGDSATLTVASANAASAVINPGNRTVNLDNSGAGEVTVSPTATTEYTLTVTDANSVTATDTATVTVNPAPTVTFTAAPSSITAGSGQESTLSWTVTGASAGAVVSIDNSVGADVGLSGTRTVSPADDTTYTLTVTDANSFAAATATAAVTVEAASTITFTAADASITSGQSATLHWTATNAKSAVINPGAIDASPASGGSTTVTPTADTTYTLTVTDNNDATSTAQLTVTVADAPAVTLNADETTITDGQSTTLRWTASGDGIGAEIDQGIGEVNPPTGGSTTVSPSADTTYTITVTDSNGVSVEASVTVNVDAPSTISFTAADASITSGQSTTLHWTATNAKSAVINPGAIDASPASGGSTTVTPTADTTYTLTVTDNNDATSTAQLTVTVADAPAVSSFTVSPATITVGQSATLEWTATGDAITASIDRSVGAVSPATGGSTTVTPTAAGAITYRLTVTDSNNVTATATAALTVEAASTISFTADDASITSGQSATLRWTATNAKSAEIDQGVGEVSPAAGGSVQVSPTADTTYTLTVTDNNDATSTAQLTVTVADAPAVTSFTVTPATITVGRQATLQWAATGDAITASIDQGVGTVSPATGGSTTVSPTADTTYTITVTDSNGVSVQADAAVTVEAASTIGFTADDASITSGQSATLRWTATNAKSAEIDQGVGAVAPASGGSVQVSPTADTTYTLTVTDNNDATSTAQLTVTVADAPAVTSFTATPATITVGRQATLQWAATGDAITASIDQGVGTVSPATGGSTTVSPEATITYTLTVTDSNNVTATARATVNIDAPSTITFTADDTSITSGQSATLRWTATNAESAEIDQGVGAVAPASGGSVQVSPTADTTYTLTVTDPNDVTSTAQLTVTVADAPAVTSFTATPATITVGQSATLQWAATGDAITASIDQGVGTVSPATGGSTTVSPTATTTYTITVTDSNGVSAQADATVTVSAAPTLTFSADPAEITSQQSSTLTWTASSGVSAKIDPDVGAVAPVAGGSVQVSPLTTTTYTLTVLDANGFETAATATVTVTDAPRATLSAAPATIDKGGTATLTWTSANAVSAEIDPDVGVVTPVAGGSVQVSPEQTTIYTLTVTGSNGATVTAAAVVTVSDAPRATLSAAPATINKGGTATLTWTSANAVSAEIDPDVGVVTPVAGGSVQVSPEQTTTYTLTVTGSNGATVTAAAVVTVSDAPRATLSAAPATIDQGGAATLAWTSANAVSAEIDPDVGVVTPVAGGSVQVSPTADTAYTITVSAADGRTASATATVAVRAPKEEPAVRARTLKLSFGLRQDDEPGVQTAVLYAENGEADFLLQPGPRWITAEPASGRLAEDEETTIEVTADPAGLRVGAHTGRLYVRSGGRVTSRIRVTLEVLDPAGPAVAEHGVFNAAVMSAFGPQTSPFSAVTLLPVAPGSMVVVQGRNFTGGESMDAAGFPLPASLGGVKVKFDGLEARLFALGPQRIEAQLPSALSMQALEAAGAATAAVVVETAEGGSYARRFPVAAQAPGIFTASGEGTGQGAVLLADTGALAAPHGYAEESRPARAGDVLEIYATGLGAVYPPVADGENSCAPEGVCLADGANIVLRRTAERPLVTIGGVEVAEDGVLFSGLAPALAAVNLVVVEVPQGIEPSAAADMTVTIGGRKSQPGVTIAVE